MAQPHFHFSTSHYPQSFELISFSAKEAVSSLFRFILELKVSINEDIDLITAVDDKAQLVVTDDDDSRSRDYIIDGMIASVEEVFRTSTTHKFYRAIMVPPIWRQTQSLSYDIYTKSNVIQVLEDELRNDIAQDFLMATTANYPEKEFICQYQESNFNFVSRLAEHWGIYYYFNHEEQGQMVFADDTNYDEIISRTLVLDESNNPAASFDTVRSLRKIINNTVDGIIITDINPDQASTHIEGKAGETGQDKSCVRLVNESVDNKDEADFIARLRLQEYQCMETVYTGTSGIPTLAPGFILKVSHNGTVTEMLVLEVQHRGANLDNTAKLNEGGQPAFYECSFLAIPRAAQYRPKRETPRPVAVSSSARIYSADDKKNIAQRDEKGRYQVIFDFLPKPTDNSTKHVSHWLRMAQSAARTNHYDIPLVPETEVKMGFSAGNPDRPYIMNALENSQSTRVPVSNANPHHAALITDGLLYTETAKSHKTLHLSSQFLHKDVIPVEFSQLDFDGKDSGNKVDEIKGEHHIQRRYGDEYSFIDGNNYTYGRECSFHFGQDYNEYHANWNAVDESNNDFKIEKDMLYPSDRSLAKDSAIEASKQVGLVEKSYGNKYNYLAGTESNWAHGPDGQGAHKTFNYGGRYEENQTLDPKARIDDVNGFPETPDDKALVKKTIGNTFSYQEGNNIQVAKGDVTSELEGNTLATVKGNNKETITGDLELKRKGKEKRNNEGDVEESTTGNIKREQTGDLDNKVTGKKNEQVTGDVKIDLMAKVEETLHGKLDFMGMGGANITVKGTREVTVDNEVQTFTAANVDIKTKSEKLGSSTIKAQTIMTDSKLIDTKAKMIMKKADLIMLG
jgi:type VI secretion system VgrG family protein